MIYINTIGIVPAYACNVCDALVARWLTSMIQNGRPTLNERETDVAQSYTSSGIRCFRREMLRYVSHTSGWALFQVTLPTGRESKRGVSVIWCSL